MAVVHEKSRWRTPRGMRRPMDTRTPLPSPPTLHADTEGLSIVKTKEVQRNHDEESWIEYRMLDVVETSTHHSKVRLKQNVIRYRENAMTSKQGVRVARVSTVA